MQVALWLVMFVAQSMLVQVKSLRSFRKPLSSALALSSSVADRQSQGRFWSKSTSVAIPEGLTQPQLAEHLSSCIRCNPRKECEKELVSEFGMWIVPSRGLILPVHGGVPQPQHAVFTKGYSSGDIPQVSEIDSTEKITAVVCGFHPRAQHDEIEQSSRILNEERLAAIVPHLLRICGNGVTVEGLLSSEEFDGTPPSRVLRKFLYPRSDTQSHTTVPVDVHARRTADQIALSLRRLRADRAAVLRNVDRPATEASNEAVVHNNADREETLTAWFRNIEKTRENSQPVYLVLDSIRSAHNVGSLFRTADVAQIRGIVTCGITPHPPFNEKLRKTALQSLETVPSLHVDDICAAVRALQAEACRVVVCETTTTAVDYIDCDLSHTKPLALVLGNEISGVDARLLQLETVEIRSVGRKNSLNVASAGAVLLYEAIRQLRQ